MNTVLPSPIVVDGKEFEWDRLLEDDSSFQNLNSYIVDAQKALSTGGGEFGSFVYGVLNSPKMQIEYSLKQPMTKIEKDALWDSRLFRSLLHIEKNLGVRAVVCDQKHTNITLEVDGANIDDFSIRDGDGLRVCDGLITKMKDVMLLSSSMDCVCVAARHPKTGYIGVLHSGWRGSVAGANENFLMAFEERGCPTEELVVFVAPSIAAKNYEVKDDLYDAFMDAYPASGKFFYKDEGRLFFDNRGFVVEKYRKVMKIVDCKIDVFSNHLFASHRYEVSHPKEYNYFGGNFLFALNR